KSVMFPAPRIKPRCAARTTRLTLHILPNRQLCPAPATKNRKLIPLTFRPHDNRMTRQLQMTILASPIFPAALHLDRDDVGRPVIMSATSLRIQSHAAHL